MKFLKWNKILLSVCSCMKLIEYYYELDSNFYESLCCSQLWVRHMICGQTCDGLYHFAFYLINFGIPQKSTISTLAVKLSVSAIFTPRWTATRLLSGTYWWPKVMPNFMGECECRHFWWDRWSVINESYNASVQTFHDFLIVFLVLLVTLTDSSRCP